MKKVKEVDPFDVLSDAQKAELSQLETMYGVINTIIAKDEHGNTLATFLKKLKYDTKKKVMMMIMQDQTKIIEAGEIILIDSYAGGDDLFANEDTRLEAAIQAYNLFNIDDTVQMIKKN